MILVYILGYLVVAFAVTKVGYLIFKEKDESKNDEIKTNSVVIGITWIISLPMLVVVAITMILVFGMIELGKKIL